MRISSRLMMPLILATHATTLSGVRMMPRSQRTARPGSSRHQLLPERQISSKSPSILESHPTRCRVPPSGRSSTQPSSLRGPSFIVTISVIPYILQPCVPAILNERYVKTIPCNYLLIQWRSVFSDAGGAFVHFPRKQTPPLWHILLIGRIKISASLTQQDCRYYAL